MKKFFEKHDLFKLVSIFVIIAIIATWLFPKSVFDGGIAVAPSGAELDWKFDLANRSPIGLFDWSSYSLLGFYYFTATFIFILLVAGFYKFLGNTKAYQSLTDKLAKIFKGKESILIALASFFIAAFAGVATDPYITILFIPFIITIMNKLKISKSTALLSTFGSVLVGILGSTYSTKITGSLIDTKYGLGTVGVKIGFELVALVIIFIVAYLLLNYFSIKLKNRGEVVEDLFAYEDKRDKKKIVRVNTLPLTIILVIFGLIAILAYIPWESSFNITFFKDLADNILEFDDFLDVNIFSYILGTAFKEFGSLDLFGIMGYMFIIVVLIKIIYHITLDEVFDSFCEGFKKIIRPLALLIFIHTLLEFTVLFPVLPGLIEAFVNFVGKNAVSLFVSGLVTQTFAIDFQYTVSTLGSLFATYKDPELAALILQLSGGLISFITPTSAILAFGLSMLNIKFSEYLKTIWKFLLLLTIVIIIVLIILVYI